MRHFLNAFSQLIIPNRCRLCGALLPLLQKCEPLALEGYLCALCCESIHYREAEVVLSHPAGSYGLVAATEYGGAVAELIRGLKFSARTEFSRPLAAVMWQHDGVRDCLVQADTIVCVPLHPYRRLRRGFNQVRVLAGHFPRIIKAKIQNGVVRTRHTAAQSSLSALQRRRNMGGAFALRDSAALEGRHVLVVDDVVSTGSTMSACSEVIKSAHPASIQHLALAFAEKVN